MAARDLLLQRLRQVRLFQVDSKAVRALGYDPEYRMAVVQFTGADTLYGYPHLTDDEVAGLLEVLDQHDSLGHYVSTVIKPAHDHERVQL